MNCSTHVDFQAINAKDQIFNKIHFLLLCNAVPALSQKNISKTVFNTKTFLHCEYMNSRTFSIVCMYCICCVPLTAKYYLLFLYKTFSNSVFDKSDKLTYSIRLNYLFIVNVLLH